MRILVDIDERELLTLERVARANRRSRAAVIRQAIADYVAIHHPAPADAAFALWNASGEDGLAHQDRLRDEW